MARPSKIPANERYSRNRALVSDIALALAEATDLAEMLQRCARAVVTHLDAAFARIWTVDRSGEWLELRASAGLYEHVDGRHGRVRVGELKIGRIAAERTAHVTNDVLRDPQVSDPEWARREGMVAFAGYPLMVADRLVGVLALFARHELPSDTLEALASIAHALAVGVDRGRTYRRLIEAETRLGALSAEDRLARTIADNATMALFVMDDRQRCTFMNPAAEVMTGFTFDEVRARNEPLHDIIHHLHPDGRPYPMLDCPIDRALPTRAREKGEDVFVHRNGHFYPVAFTASPIMEGGVAVGTVIEVRDTTAEKRAERAANLLAHASTALASSLDYRAVVPGIVAEMVPMLGVWAGVWVEQESTPLTLLAQAHHGDASEAIGRVLAERPPDVGTGELDELGGTKVMVVPLETRGRTLGRIAVAREGGAAHDAADQVTIEELARRIGIAIDNTRLFELSQEERRRAEAASRAKDELLAVTSHELRTPLNAILGWARLLRAGALDEAKRERALETIERNARIQVRLIEDLLDVSRVITGRLRLDVGRVDVAQVVLAAVDVVRPAAAAKGVRLGLTRVETGIVNGDASRLQQIVWNLLSNAVKFTPRGGHVDVTLCCDDHQVEIAVRDTGQGISSEFVETLFQPFRQEDSSITRAHGGLGLGLAIAKYLVELHGGSIRAESAGPGSGATFAVRLPLVAGGMTTASRPSFVGRSERPNPSATLARDLDGIRVLAVDDDPDSLYLVSSILEDQRAKVTTACSAGEALARLDAELPDIIIADVGMPGESGYDLIRKIRARSTAEGGRVPAIALTAYAAPGDRTRALREGFTSHAAKPTEPGELIAVISAILLTSRQEEAAPDDG